MPDGFVTQTRKVYGNAFDGSWSARAIGLSQSGTFLGWADDVQLQTTYSYRTGKNSLLGSLEDELSTLPSNEAGVFDYLSKDKESIALLHPGDTGHEFTTSKVVCNGISVPNWNYDPPSRPDIHYSGPIIPAKPPNSWLVPPGLGNPVLNSGSPSFYGTVAINRTNPGRPHLSVAEILGEILQRSWAPSLSLEKRAMQYVFPDSLKKRFKGDTRVAATLKRVPDEYLNYEFGWIPFREDVEDIVRTVAASSRTLKQMARDNDKSIRRHYEFPIKRYSEKGSMGNFKPITPPGPGGAGSLAWNALWPSTYTHTYFQTIEQLLWFKGCYIYHMPVDSGLLSIMERCERLAGIELTPVDIWDLSPWSWLADWQTNIGSILSNLSYLSAQGVALKYGYLMCSTIQRLNIQISPAVYGLYPACDWFSTKKERFRATPYGFGLNPASFTDGQWAILSALGLSKAWKVLW